MPPRRSNVSMISAADNEAGMMDASTSIAYSDTAADGRPGTSEGQPGKGKKKARDGEPEKLSIDDFMMPRMMTTRLAKGVMPSGTTVQKDAVTALTYGASIFLNHIANAANEHCLNASRKTITPADIFAGLKDSEFAAWVAPLQKELEVYARQQSAKRSAYKQKVKQQQQRDGVGVGGGAGVGGGRPGGKTMGALLDDEEGHRLAKRPRLDEGAGAGAGAGARGGVDEGDVDEEELLDDGFDDEAPDGEEEDNEEGADDEENGDEQFEDAEERMGDDRVESDQGRDADETVDEDDADDSD